MTSQNGRAFNEWLRAQLKAKKMSQRQLAQQSGVDHSTISRLIRGDRMPSLGTATKLARGLREIREDADTPQYLGLVTSGSANPTARVEYSLRADEALGEPQVRQVMEYYLAVRMRRYRARLPRHRPHGEWVGPCRPAAPKPRADRAKAGRAARRRCRARPANRNRASASEEPVPTKVRPLGYISGAPVYSSLTPRVGVATRVTATTLTRPTGRNSDRY